MADKLANIPHDVKKPNQSKFNKAPKLLRQLIRKRYYKTMGTSVITIISFENKKIAHFRIFTINGFYLRISFFILHLFKKYKSVF